MPTHPTLASVRAAIISCDRCPRLRAYCQRIAREKRAAFRHDTYWGKPVPGFGDPQARVAVIGLAPAAHGANRTGRNFTGDGGGGSGDFLMAAMHANGFANQPTSQSADDGLVLTDAWIMAVARCAPPDNKPTPREIANCEPHLIAELNALPNLKVYVALGRIAYDAVWRLVRKSASQNTPPSQDTPASKTTSASHSTSASKTTSASHSTSASKTTSASTTRRPELQLRHIKKPAFEHGLVIRIPSGPAIVCAYHPSRQNTHTGRLTQPMLRDAFRSAKRLARR